MNKFSLDIKLKTTVAESSAFKADPFSSMDMSQWASAFPQSEVWYVESFNEDTGTYNLKNQNASQTMRGVKNISRYSGVLEEDTRVMVGFYDCDRNKPYLMHSLSGALATPPGPGGEPIGSDWVTFMQNRMRAPFVPGAHVITTNVFGTIVGPGNTNTGIPVRIYDNKLLITKRAAGVDTLGLYNNAHLSSPLFTYTSPGCIQEIYVWDFAIFLVEWNTTSLTENSRQLKSTYFTGPFGSPVPAWASRVVSLSRDDLSVLNASEWDSENLYLPSPSLMVTNIGFDAIPVVLAVRKVQTSLQTYHQLYQINLSINLDESTATALPFLPLPIQEVTTSTRTASGDGWSQLITKKAISPIFAKSYYEFESIGTPPTSVSYIRDSNGKYQLGVFASDVHPSGFNVYTGGGSLITGGGIKFSENNTDSEYDSPSSEICDLRNWICFTNNNAHIPVGTNLLQLTAFRFDTAERKWAVKGWEQDTDTLEFYTPVLGHHALGKLLVFTVVERYMHGTLNLGHARAVYTSFDDATPHFESPGYYRECKYRICHAQEFYYDVYDILTGMRETRTRLDSSPIISYEDIPTGSSSPILGSRPVGIAVRSNHALIKDNSSSDINDYTIVQGSSFNIQSISHPPSFPANPSVLHYNQYASIPVEVKQDRYPLHHPYNAAVSGAPYDKIIFAPWWENTSKTNDAQFVNRRSSSGVDSDFLLGGNWERGLLAFLSCKSWPDLAHVWNAGIGSSNPTNKTFSNIVVYSEDQAAIHFRHGGIAFIWRIQYTPTVALIQQTSYSTAFGHSIANTQSTALSLTNRFDSTGTEVLYAKDNALFTQAGVNIITFRGGV